MRAMTVKHLFMQRDQGVKKDGDAFLRVLNKLQPLAQLDQQFGHKLHQAGAVAPGQNELNAPDQVIDEREIAARVSTAVGTTELGLRHHLRPRAAQEIGHEFRDVLVFMAFLKVVGESPRQQVSLLCVQERARRLFVLLTLGRVLASPVRFEFAQHQGEGGAFRLTTLQCVDRLCKRLHKPGKPLVAARGVAQAAIGDPVQELTRRMLALAEKAGVGLGQRQQHRLQRLDQLPHLGQQPLILHEVVEHHAHHFLAQLGTELSALGRLARNRLTRLLRLRARFRLASPLGEALHHRLNKFEVLERDIGGGHGMQEILHARAGAATGCEFAREQLPKFVKRHQRACHRTRGALAGHRPGTPQRGSHRSCRFNGLRQQPLADFPVKLAKSHAQQSGRRRDQRGPRLFVGRILLQARLQGPHKWFGLQGIKLGLHRDPAQQTADQRIQRRQHIIHTAGDFLLRHRKFDAGVDLLGIEQLQIFKAHQRLLGKILRPAVVNAEPQLHHESFFHRRGLTAQQIGHRRADRKAATKGTFCLGLAGRRRQAGQHVRHQKVGLLQHDFNTVV